jgi:hypothetical protein
LPPLSAVFFTANASILGNRQSFVGVRPPSVTFTVPIFFAIAGTESAAIYTITESAERAGSFSVKSTTTLGAV